MHLCLPKERNMQSDKTRTKWTAELAGSGRNEISHKPTPWPWRPRRSRREQTQGLAARRSEPLAAVRLLRPSFV